MPRALFLCTTIVAAFQLHLAAASPNVEDAPVTPGVSAIAVRLGIEAARNPADFVSQITRLLTTRPDSRTGSDGGGNLPRVSASSAGPASDRGTLRVPVPLPAEVWGRDVFHRAVSREELIAAILADRRATLLAHGLTGVDDETLAFLADHGSLLTFLYERAAGGFAAFGDTFRVSGGRVLVPGGTDAEPLWEAIVHERVSAPERFARALFGNAKGRLAYFYAVVASADRTAARFTLGLWIADENVRLDRFMRLAEACTNGYSEWDLNVVPFSRPMSDLAVLLLRLRVLPTGAPAAPSGRAFWADVFDIGDALPSAGSPSTGPASGLVDAAWLVDATGAGDMYTRGERLDQFAFGQRVFAHLPEDSAAEVAQTVRAFRTYRMLLLTLERIGVRHPSVYAAALRQASAVTSADQDRRFWAIAQYQGGLALVSRMHRAATIDAALAERLVLSIARVAVDDDGTYRGGMAEWIATELAPHLPPGDGWESRIGEALAGPHAPESAPRLFWEGQAYRVDLPFAERRRFEAVRAKQGGHTVDIALTIEAHARALRSALTLDSARAAATAMRATAAEHQASLRRPPVNLLAPGVEAPMDGFEWLTKAADDVEKIAKPADLPRSARIARSMSELADIVLGNALVSIAYAVDLGDVDGTALLGANVALRHDFGFARREGATRARMPWSLPRQDFMPGVPWHITGSVLGLDIALAPLALRRLTLDALPDAPKLASVEREAFAVGVSLMEPARLTDRDRDAIAAAIARGRQRVMAMAAGSAPLAVETEPLMLDGRRLRAVEWAREHDPAALSAQFSLAELFLLGGGAAGADLDAWGASGVHAWGCACTRFPPTTAWRILAGRSQLPFMAGTLTDLNLSIVVMMSEMKLPAALTRTVLASATRDFIDDSSPVDSNDWWSLARTAQAVRRQRVEDYVAAAAAVDGPLVPEQAGVSPQP